MLYHLLNQHQKFFDTTQKSILDGLERCVRKADKALAASSGSSFRAISASNRGKQRREPARRLARPMELSRTCVTTRLTTALHNQGKCAPSKFSWTRKLGHYERNKRTLRKKQARNLQDPWRGLVMHITDEGYIGLGWPPSTGVIWLH